MTARQRWCSLLILAIAFAFRVWALDYKPAHFDEGVNGAFIDSMRVEGCYRYDPANYHGPLHFYTLFAGQQLFGRSLWVLRMPTVLIGTASVLLLIGMRRFFGFNAAAWAAIAVAVSPAMVFYSRYAIHEMWLPFFAILACHGGFGLASGERRTSDLWRLGLGLAGMILTKETYLVHFAAAFLAYTVLWLFAPARGKSRPADLFAGSVHSSEVESATVQGTFTNADVLRVAVWSCALIAVFYSGFFMHWEGISGLFSTFREMMAKGTDGEGHHKEMLYWVKLLAHYEWPAVAGLIAALIVTFPRWPKAGLLLVIGGITLVVVDRNLLAIHELRAAPYEFLKPQLGLDATGSIGTGIAAIGLAMACALPTSDLRIRWCALYGLGSLAAYSLIPYKTPWCIVNIVWPFTLIVGHALQCMSKQTRPHLVGLVGVLLLTPSAIDTVRLNFNDRTERPNPTLDSLAHRIGDTFLDGDRYAYVQTSFDINNLLDPLNKLVAINPANRQLVGHVIGESFPLVWLLNDFPNVQFHEPDATLDECNADFLLIPYERVYDIEPRLRGIYYRQPHRTRSGGTECWLYLLADRFEPVMPPDREPELVPRVPQSDPAEAP